MLPSAQLLDSGLATAAPLAFNLSRGSSGLSINSNSSSNCSDPDLVLDSCTVSTSCDNLAQFAAWLYRQQQQQQAYLNVTQVSGACVCGGGGGGEAHSRLGLVGKAWLGKAWLGRA